jgi:hypothetical protein
MHPSELERVFEERHAVCLYPSNVITSNGFLYAAWKVILKIPSRGYTLSHELVAQWPCETVSSLQAAPMCPQSVADARPYPSQTI